MSGELEHGPGPGPLPDPDRVRIPDDAAALDADLWAWQAEQARLARPVPWTAPGHTSPWRVAGRVGPMMLGAMLLVAFLASLATTVRPADVDAVPAAPLARTQLADGQIGGLLPPGIVDVNGATQSTRAIRPATLLILPASGADPELLDAIHLQSTSYGIPFALVGPTERLPLLASTADDIGVGTVPVVIDRSSVIEQSLGLPRQADPTVVVVGADGRIQTVLEDPPAGIRLESVLSRAAAGSDPVGS